MLVVATTAGRSTTIAGMSPRAKERYSSAGKSAAVAYTGVPLMFASPSNSFA